jgi:hypothetical protein
LDLHPAIRSPLDVFRDIEEEYHDTDEGSENEDLEEDLSVEYQERM